MLDLHTMVIALTFTFTLQAIMFLFMTLFINAYKGLRLWAFGFSCLALNFIMIYMRGQGYLVEWMILGSNLISLVALLCFYYGTKQFLKLPIDIRIPIIFSILYSMTFAYFTFVSNQMNVRVIIFSVMMGSILIKNAHILILYRRDTFKSSALILAIIFIIIGTFFLLRTIHTIFYPITNNDFFGKDFMQTITMLISLCMGIIWTQGVILLVNQKLQGELTLKTLELESTNLEKDRFFSVLAHDLRGPINNLVSMMDLLADEKSKLGSEMMQKMAAVMKKSVHSTNTLLENLLDWATLQRGLKEINQQQTTIGELLFPVMPPLLIQADSKKISIVNEIPATTTLTSDVKMVQSIFRNLISNAIKFTPPNGSIRLSSNVSDQGFLFFSVSDNGIGMDKNTMDTLFSVVPHSLRLGTGGESSTGLGLMICKEFVEKHSGRIWVESEVGKGSTFSFCLNPVV